MKNKNLIPKGIFFQQDFTKYIPRITQKRKEEIGASPDQLIFRGTPKSDRVEMQLIHYGGEQLEETAIERIAEVIPYVQKEGFTWLNIDGLHDTSLIEEISKTLNFEMLMLADVMNTHARPTVTEYDTGLFISLKMLRQDAATNLIFGENLSLLLNDSLLISFQEMKGDVFEPVRDRIRKQKRRISNSGTDYLAFALLDVIIDNYIVILSAVGENIELLEESLIERPEDGLLDKIYFYKRELNFLRRNIKPAKEMITNLVKEDYDVIHEDNEVHYLELLNNINHANDLSDSYRDILSDQLNIYHTTMSSKLNDIMKFLTVFSVIFIPLTFIAGIYGTNFTFIPELQYRYGYFVMLAVMALISLGMMIYFKRNKWL